MIRVVDLFAGFGGFTLGATLAGASVVYAANHWPLAVEVHAANHPGTQHECQDLRQADFTRLPVYDLLVASPACQGHSQASRPRRRAYHDEVRSTAWAVVDCADATSPRAIIVENVLDLRRWRLYSAWLGALHALGYVTAEHVVNAAELGVPQRRTRLFVVVTRAPVTLDLLSLDEQPFAPCLDDLAAGWRLVRAAPEPVRTRIAAGRARCGRRFLSQHVTGHRGVPLDEPIRTITTKNQWLLVDGDSYRSLTPRELARGMSFPDSFGWPASTTMTDAIRGIGNAVPPLMAAAVVAATIGAAL